MRSLWVCSLVFAVAPRAHAAERELSAEDIVHRAIEVQKQHEDAGNEVKYDYDLVSVTEKLDKHGEVEKVEEQLYRSHHIEGVAYERLVEKDGRELTDKESAKERKREEKFRKKLKKGEAKHNDADDRVAFDEELLSRYDVERIGVRPIGGRDCYVLWFEPKPGKLPVEKTVDRALNKAEGHIWIDTESFEIARIEFELREKIRLWWGMMGSVSKMSGMFQRHPMPDDIWLPERFDFYMQARMLFRSIHVRQQVVWNDFERRRETIASNP
jgi:hypothetical protein